MSRRVAMPHWNIFQWLLLVALVVLVGLPLWIKGKITGSQEGRFVDWLDERLTNR
jgi:hypothetical protein